MMKINWNDSRIHYCGRMEKDPECDGIRWAFAASSAYLRFRGSEISIRISAKSEWWNTYLGVIIDGVQSSIKISVDEASADEYILARDLDPDMIHELLVFKRMDTANLITIKGFELNDDSQVLDANTSNTLLAKELGIGSGKRIEFFGDSVSCGEVSEAVLYTGKKDPVHNGEYSNSWYSYAWYTSRKLHAQIHDTSQGGIALLNNTGWYHEPNYDGMESFYDKCQPNKNLAALTSWDFTSWTPQAVVVAIGQNDSHPDDYMRADYNCKKAVKWRSAYADFLKKLLNIYKETQIICATTILNHDPSWDKAIDDAIETVCSDRLHHFLYSKNGCGTPGHIRISEADEMSDELSAYIDRII